jgi:hypothetical protein
MTKIVDYPEVDKSKPVWPSGERVTVLELNCGKDALIQKFGLLFQRMQDGLDWFYGGLLHHETYGYIGFVEYDGLPGGGIIVYMDFDMALQIGSADAVVDELQLPHAWIPWKNDKLNELG